MAACTKHSADILISRIYAITTQLGSVLMVKK